MKVLVLQASTHRNLIDLTQLNIQNWCKEQNFEYIFEYTPDFKKQYNVSPYWIKIFNLNKYLGRPYNYELIVWLDDDCVLQKSFNPCTILQDDKDLGLVRHLAGKQDHLNTGMMIIRNTQKIRVFFDLCWLKGDTTKTDIWNIKNWHDQNRILTELERYNVKFVQEIPSYYNYNFAAKNSLISKGEQVIDDHEAIIFGFHGYKDRENTMKNYIKNLKKL